MDEVTLDQLVQEHLETYSSIDAVSDDQSKEIWTDKKLTPFVGVDVSPPVRKSLCVRLPSLNDDTIEELKERIAQLDPMGRERLVP